jgi:hypothetical protein
LFGATRSIAESIADGLRASFEVECLDIRKVDPDRLGAVDLLVVGAPTHMRTLPGPRSRSEGARWLESRMRGHQLQPHATAPGVREWLAVAVLDGTPAAAFTTRADVPRFLGGSAATGIARRLRRAGARVTVRGFEARVDEQANLLVEENARATDWGRRLAERTARRTRSSGRGPES